MTLEEYEKMLAAQGEALTQGGQELGRRLIDEPIKALKEDWRQKANVPAPKAPVRPDPISGQARDNAAISAANMYEKMRQKAELIPGSPEAIRAQREGRVVPSLQEQQMDDFDRRQLEIAAEKKQAEEIANRRFQQEMAEKDARFEELRKKLSGQ